MDGGKAYSEEDHAKPDKRLVMAGASHAGRLAAPWSMQAHMWQTLHEPTWHMDEAGVSQVTEEMKRILEELEPVDGIVYQMVDNRVYFAGAGRGQRQLPLSGTQLTTNIGGPGLHSQG